MFMFIVRQILPPKWLVITLSVFTAVFVYGVFSATPFFQLIGFFPTMVCLLACLIIMGFKMIFADKGNKSDDDDIREIIHTVLEGDDEE